MAYRNENEYLKKSFDGDKGQVQGRPKTDSMWSLITRFLTYDTCFKFFVLFCWTKTNESDHQRLIRIQK